MFVTSTSLSLQCCCCCYYPPFDFSPAKQKTHELDVHLNVSNILDQLSSGTLDGNDPRLDGDGDTLGDGERFDRRDILHCECMLMVTIGYSRPLILLSYAQPGGGVGGRGRQKGRKYFSILPESDMSVAPTFTGYLNTDASLSPTISLVSHPAGYPRTCSLSSDRRPAVSGIHQRKVWL